jgi:hypothetical protein
MGTRNKQKQPKKSQTKLLHSETIVAPVAALLEAAAPVAVAEDTGADNLPEHHAAAAAEPQVVYRTRTEVERRYIKQPNPIANWFRVWQAKRQFVKAIKSSASEFTPGWRQRCLNMVRQWEGPGHPFPFEPIPSPNLVGRTPYYKKSLPDSTPSRLRLAINWFLRVRR